MSYVSNIVLTARYMSPASKERLEAVDLGNGQHLKSVSHAAGGHKGWEADTWMAAVNYARLDSEIRAELAEAIDYGVQVVLLIHHEETADEPVAWWLPERSLAWRRLMERSS